MINTQTELKERFLNLLDNAEPVTEKSGSGSGDSSDQSSNKRVSQGAVDQLLTLLSDDKLYVSVDDGSCFIFRKGRLFLLDTKHRELFEDLRLEGFEAIGSAPSKESVGTVIELLTARARRDGEKIELFNRMGEHEGKFYYDLNDGKAVEIRDDGWKIVDEPTMFLKFKHQLPQLHPDSDESDIGRIFEFVRIKEEQQLLFLVILITSFVPRISHPAVHITGTQGSGKSFGASLIKKLIDPSSVLLSLMPRRPDDLDLLLVRHKNLIIDNLSSLSFDTCDRLCAVISGGAMERRTLHTDLETTILKGNPVIFYTSIGSIHSRPDLTERTVVIELQRIPDKERMDEPELLKRFNCAVPAILSGIFDTLAYAMRRIPFCSVEKLPRMAEFAKWGVVIAECLGYDGNQFLADYAGNTSIQATELIERDTFFAAIVEAMNQPDREPLSGSFSEIILSLSEIACPGEAANGYSSLQKDKTFPTARGIRKHLERIRIPLENFGISFVFDNQRTAQAKAFVTFSKMEDPVPEIPDLSEYQDEPPF